MISLGVTEDLEEINLGAHQKSLMINTLTPIIKHIRAKLELSPQGELAEVVFLTWKRTLRNQELPVFFYLSCLLENGVDVETVTKLVDVLFCLGVDVSDPHSSSSELSIIIGYLSEKLLGKNLGSLRRTVDEIESKDFSINTLSSFIIDFHANFTATLPKLKLQHDELRQLQRQLILSDNNYKNISKEILSTSNNFIEGLLGYLIKRIWQKLNIPCSSSAVIYFRDMKTYAGDLDFYYWGPKPHLVVKLLSKYLIVFGYKVDHRSYMLVQSIIDSRGGLDNAYLGAYLFLYFFMGKSVEINKGVFDYHYCKDVLPAVNLSLVWPALYQRTLDNLSIWQTTYSAALIKYPGFKELQFRVLAVLLMGLSARFNITYTLNFENFLEKLGPHLKEPEVGLLRNLIYMINQVRNLYQLISQRRWEMIDDTVIKKIEVFMHSQGVPKWRMEMEKSGYLLQNMATKYLGNPSDFKSVGKTFTDYENIAKPTLRNSYLRVEKLYMELIHEK